MDNIQKKCLNANLLYLQDNMVMSEELSAALIQYKIFTDDAVEAFMAEKTTKGKILAFVRRLKKCNNLRFDTFLYILGEVHQEHIAERLKMTEKTQREDSANKIMTDKVRTFIHDKFIQNKHFSSVEERFIIENLVLKDDYEERKVEKELAITENRRLSFANLEKDKVITDINMKLQLSLRENKKGKERVAELDQKVDVLEGEVTDLKIELEKYRQKITTLEKEMREKEEEIAILKIAQPKTDVWAETAPKLTARQVSAVETAPKMTEWRCSQVRDDDCIDGVAVDEEEPDLGEELQQEIDRLRRLLLEREDRVITLNQQTLEVLQIVGVPEQTDSQSEAEGRDLDSLEAKINQLKALYRAGIRPRGKLQHNESNGSLMSSVSDDQLSSLQTKLNQSRKERTGLRNSLSNLQRQLGNISLKLESERVKVKHMEQAIRSRGNTPSSYSLDFVDGSDVSSTNTNYFYNLGNNNQRINNGNYGNQLGVRSTTCLFPDLTLKTQGQTRAPQRVDIQLPAQVTERGVKRNLNLIKLAQSPLKRPKQFE